MNVPTIAFVASPDLFYKMPPLQTVQVWTSQACLELQRVEFWGSMRRTRHAKNGLVTATWPCEPELVWFAMARARMGSWIMLGEDATMLLGPNATTNRCPILCRCECICGNMTSMSSLKNRV